ncbi:hypothetical protein CONPUDRAFT_105938, partial [Coniophora puteana RWD-64-598 SS2]
MPTKPRKIGTLVVVVLKARNLVNKRYFGKQDPYCAISFNGDIRRTKAIKRGGQHPEWDEELRFTMFADEGVELSRTVHGSDIPPPLPPKGLGTDMRVQRTKAMRLSCYSAEPRDPKLIGKTLVDLTEVLTEWFPLLKKDKYSGEVYLEPTFFSNMTDKTAELYGQYGTYDLVNSPAENTYYPMDRRGESSHATLANNNKDNPLLSLSSIKQYKQGARTSSGRLDSGFSELGVVEPKSTESLLPMQTPKPSA